MGYQRLFNGLAAAAVIQQSRRILFNKNGFGWPHYISRGKSKGYQRLFNGLAAAAVMQQSWRIMYIITVGLVDHTILFCGKSKGYQRLFNGLATAADMPNPENTL